MAESTVLIKPFQQEFNEESIKSAFKKFAIKRINVNRTAKEAYVELPSPQDVEALSTDFPDCIIPALGGA